MDWIRPFLMTWGYILVGIGILSMVLVCAHLFIQWVREINAINETIRR